MANLVRAAHAPEMYRVLVETTAGRFDIDVHRQWSPCGANRFYDLVTHRYYDDSRFFRVVAGKWVQFGIAGDPVVAQAWRGKAIADDTLVQSNTFGFVAFANIGQALGQPRFSSTSGTTPRTTIANPALRRSVRSPPAWMS
jgi:cyclophilin family peptidyl-prolyl cis-trans isomerase